VGRTAVEDFVHHLTRAERSPLTIKNYRCDLAAFASWFRDTNGDELTPAHITPTDLRDYKRFLVDHRRLRPSRRCQLIRASAMMRQKGGRVALLSAFRRPWPCP
jgi:site-specific recombinase XerD